MRKSLAIRLLKRPPHDFGVDTDVRNRDLEAHPFEKVPLVHLNLERICLCVLF